MTIMTLCVRCKDEVLEVHFGKRRLLLTAKGKVLNSGHTYVFDSTGEVRVAVIHSEHRCNWKAVKEMAEAREIEAEKIALARGWKLYDEAIIESMNHICPKCQTPKRMKCINLAVKREIRETKHPHKERIDKALKMMGYTADTVNGVIVLRPVQPTDDPDENETYYCKQCVGSFPIAEFVYDFPILKHGDDGHDAEKQ